MQTDAHNTGREERRAQLEQRRAAVAHQLRLLAIELTDLDRQLDDIERWEGCGTPSVIEGQLAAERERQGASAEYDARREREGGLE